MTTTKRVSVAHRGNAVVIESDHAVSLAIAVLRERIQLLCREDQDDLYELLPALLGDDETERESAQQAVKEIFDQTEGKLMAMELAETPDASLKKWVDFVSRRIREARKKANWSQDMLAKKSGLGQSHISRIERGQLSPTAKTLEKIAKALGISVSHFDPSAE